MERPEIEARLAQVDTRLEALERRPNGGQHAIVVERVTNLAKAVDGLNSKILWGLGLMGALAVSIITLLVEKALT